MSDFLKRLARAAPLPVRKKLMDRMYGRFMFSKFDEVKFDAAGWRFAVPEPAAAKFAGNYHGRKIFDAYAGLGNISIQLALAGNSVTAGENHRRRLKYFRHNLAVYGVGGKVEVWPGDAEKAAAKNPGRFDLVFLDPPWKDLERKGLGYYRGVFAQAAPVLIFKLQKDYPKDGLAAAAEIKEIFINQTLLYKEAMFTSRPQPQKLSAEYLRLPELAYVFRRPAAG